MSEAEEKKAEPKPEHPNKLIAIWNREWPRVKEYPTACACSFLLGCTLIFSLYSVFIIPGKDSTIQSLQTRLDNQSTGVSNAMPTKNESSKLNENRTQWYLKIKNIEVLSKSTNDHPQTIPFRIIAIVNSQNYSFPSTQLCFTGGILTQGESVPLPIEHEKYLVQFVRQNINRILLRASITNSSVPTSGGITDSLKVNSLPMVKTNEIVIQDLQTGTDVGTTKIVYEITNQ